MKSYMILKLNSGRHAVVEKRTHNVVAKADTREEAIKLLAEIKEKDKRQATERKEAKAKEEEKVAELKIAFTDGKINPHGTTPKGNTYDIWFNNGLTERSRYCYSLDINHKTVFTSGQIETVLKEIARN